MNSAQQLIELYKHYPGSLTLLSRRRDTQRSAPMILGQLLHNPIKDFSAQSLAECGTKGIFYGENLHATLSCLPPEVVLSELGENALMFAYAAALKWTDNLNTETVARITRKNGELLEKARRTMFCLRSSRDARVASQIYTFIEQAKNLTADALSLSQVLRKNAKGNSLSEKRLKDYSLTPITTKGVYVKGYAVHNELYPSNTRFSIWLDCPFAIMLTYREEPQAIVGFIPSDFLTLKIYQLQGMRGTKIDNDGNPASRTSSRGLMPLDWQGVLIDLVERVAEKLSYLRIEVQSARRNPWTQPQPDGSIKFPLETAIKHYDLVAQRLGFERLPNGNWSKRVSFLDYPDLQIA